MSEGHEDEFTIHDLGRELRRLNGTVSDLKTELEEANDLHARRWMTTVIANVSLGLVVLTLIMGYFSVRNVTARLDNESVFRAEENLSLIHI